MSQINLFNDYLQYSIMEKNVCNLWSKGLLKEIWKNFLSHLEYCNGIMFHLSRNWHNKSNYEFFAKYLMENTELNMNYHDSEQLRTINEERDSMPILEKIKMKYSNF